MTSSTNIPTSWGATLTISQIDAEFLGGTLLPGAVLITLDDTHRVVGMVAKVNPRTGNLEPLRVDRPITAAQMAFLQTAPEAGDSFWSRNTSRPRPGTHKRCKNRKDHD